ncbi:hypothetical protein JNM05_16050 [bacterium]|nr:hypothetical protein [bacterium]
MGDQKTNWTTIVATAILSALATLAVGFVLAWFQNKEPKLAYSTIGSFAFEGNNEQLAIYQVSFSNDGSKSATNIVCCIRIPSAHVHEYRVTNDPIIRPTVSKDSVGLWLRLEHMSPKDEITISFIAKSGSNLPPLPTVSLRSDEVIGEIKKDGNENKSFLSDNAFVLVGIYLASTLLISSFFTKTGFLSLFKKRLGDDQIDVIAFIATLVGMPDEASMLLNRPRSTTYWVESDRIANSAIFSEDTDRVRKARSLLTKLLMYTTMANSSIGIIHYNITKLSFFLGENDQSKTHLALALKFNKSEILRRQSVDEYFAKNVKGDGGV